MAKDRAIEHKTFEIDVKEITETGSFEGYGAVFNNIDLGLDKIDTGAFKKTLKEQKTFPLLWQHDSHEPIGIFTAKEDENGLFIKGQLNMEVGKAKEALALLRQKAVKGLSIGYSSIKHEYEKIKGQMIRILKELKLYETSIVTFPMNPKAQVTGVKELDNIFEQIIENKNKDGFKEKILSLFDTDESGINTTQEVVEKSEGWDFEFIKNQIMEDTNE